MKAIRILTPFFLFSFFFFLFSFFSSAQDFTIPKGEESGEVLTQPYDAAHPEISPAQYEMLDKQCAENARLLKLDTLACKDALTTALSWPVQAAPGFTDCSYYSISAYVDHDPAAGSYQDYNCGTRSYDGHKGTDIYTYPFPFYKMDNSQVEIIAAAPGTILNKADGNFDRNCASNALPANYVIIQHADGSRALYWHMKNGSVTTKAIGQTVVAGEYLGVIGSSGSSSGPHLHFEIWSGATSATYNDPYAGTCNLINATSWWSSQKPYYEPALLKASVHTTDVVTPGCPTTETPNESTSYLLPFQGSGLPAGYAKFYIFIRNTQVGMTANMSILNPGGSTFTSWTYTSATYYNSSWAAWSKALPTIAGTYTFQATYNGGSCAQTFDILTSVDVNPAATWASLHVSPNPAMQYINIAAPEAGNGNYTFE
jgi:murein DD-endopeptidase MepM/ murein hydrolase activator NlpD